MAYGFQKVYEIDDGSDTNTKWAQGWFTAKNPFTFKEQQGQGNAANPYFGYTAVPYISKASNNTYYDIRLGMLNEKYGKEEDNYLVEYYTSRYSYFPTVLWVNWNVLIVIYCTRKVGMRTKVLQYNGGTSFTVIDAAQTIFSHTGSSDLSDWIIAKRDINGAIHVLYGYRQSTAKLRYLYFENSGDSGDEYDAVYWSSSNWDTGKIWDSSSSPAAGGISTRHYAYWMDIINESLVIGVISAQSSNVVKLKVTHKPITDAYNSWPSTWDIETAELPDESGSSSNKWRHLGVGASLVTQLTNGSTFGQGRRLIYAYTKVFYSTQYMTPFLFSITISDDGSPSAVDYTGGALGFPGILDNTSSLTTGPYLDKGKNARIAGIYPTYPCGWVMLYIDQGSLQNADARVLKGVKFQWGESDGDNSSIQSEPTLYDDYTAVAYSGGGPTLMIEAKTSGTREVEHLLHNVEEWGHYMQQHLWGTCAVFGTMNDMFDSHYTSGSVLFADHGDTGNDTKGNPYAIWKHNAPYLWTAKQKSSTSDRYLMAGDMYYEHVYTADGGSTEYLDQELINCLDRNKTMASKGAVVLTAMSNDIDNDVSWTNDGSSSTTFQFTIDSFGDTLHSNDGAASASNHEGPAYIRVMSFTAGNDPGWTAFGYSYDRLSVAATSGGIIDDSAGDTGIVPCGENSRFRSSLLWSVPSGSSMVSYAMFYDARKMPLMCAAGEGDNNNAVYVKRFTHTAS